MNSSQIADHRAMSTSKAYAILALVLFALYLLLSPFLTSLMERYSEITRLKQQEQQQQERLSLQNDRQRAFIASLKTKIRNGDLSPYLQPSLIAEQLQNGFKQAASNAEATIQTLQPDQNTDQEPYSEHSLNVSFRVDQHNIGVLLDALSKHTPTPRIKMLSLRTNQPFSYSVGAGQPSTLLSGQILLSQTALSRSLLSKYSEAEMLADFQKTQQESSSLKQTPVTSLASIFSAPLRARERAPSLSFYRLSAIMGNGQQRTVLITDKELGNSSRLTVGDSLAGWVLESIDAKMITMTKGDQATVLKLD